MKKLILILSTILILLLTVVLPGLASPGENGWSQPGILSQNVPANFPDIVADDYGQAHAVWAEKRGEVCTYDTVTYAVYARGEWSSPVDILISPVAPYCVGDTTIGYSAKDALLTVAWVDYRLYVASASVSQASNVSKWSNPVIVDDTAAHFPKIAVDRDGRVHLVYIRTQPFLGIYYTYSDDQAASWTDPTLLHALADQTSSDRVNIAIDGQGQIFVVWSDEFTDRGTDRGGIVYMSRSFDRGLTWDLPVVIDQKDDRYWQNYGAGEINVITAPPDTVMLVWAGAPGSHRWYQYSLDGGTTWSQPGLVAPTDVYNGAGLRNYNGGMGLAVDGCGGIHLLSSGSLHLTHLVWNNGVWGIIDSIFTFDPYWPRIAVAGGDQLLIVSAFSPDHSQAHVENLRVWQLSSQTPNSCAYVPLATATVDFAQNPDTATEQVDWSPSTPVSTNAPLPTDSQQVDVRSALTYNTNFPITLASILVFIFVTLALIGKLWKVDR